MCTQTAQSKLVLGAAALTVCTACVSCADWYKPEQAMPLKPPFDYVIAADCIYHEHIVEHFHRVVMDVTNDKSVGEPQ